MASHGHGGNAAFCSRRPRKINSAAPFCGSKRCLKKLISKCLPILPTSRRAILCFHPHEVASYRLSTKNFTTPPQLQLQLSTQPGGALTRPATRVHVGRSKRRLARSRAHKAELAARRRGPFLRTPLSSRVGTGHPVLSFTSAVFVCGIPRSECVMRDM